MELLERQIADLDEQIRQATEPFAPQLEQLQSLPGIKVITGRDIITEIGTEMRRFGSAQRLASWAGVAPGNNESAGKRARDAHAKAIAICVGCWCSVLGRPGRRRRFSGGRFGA
jgi:transposase